MLQKFVDGAIAVTKESVKTFTYESLNNIARLINGVSALLLSLMPGKANILQGIHGWELRPQFRNPWLPHWMENGVSSFNQFILELSVDSDTESMPDSAVEDYDESEDSFYPSTPTSQSSRLSHSGSFRKYDRRLMKTLRYMLSWIMWPATLLFALPSMLFQLVRPKKGRGDPVNSSESSDTRVSDPAKKSDQVLQRATDRRRGVFEDLQLAIEMFIESAFDNVHKAAHVILSPVDIWKKSILKLSSKANDGSENFSDAVQTSVLSSTEPAPVEKRTFRHSLNTDSRTCEDVITEFGYPYEAIKVYTEDGYVLLLERIPRKESRKVVYLQHGILDSSMGWVSNGVVGSPAFAAYDRGYDVFLGNLRGLVSREHTDPNISSHKYWKYSINEHGTKDIPALIEKIHSIKTSELETIQDSENEKDEQPYRLGAVCHSLGGAVMLMYIITSRIAQRPHRLSRLILLSPAGFHDDSTFMFNIAERICLFFAPILMPFVPGLYIPTRFFRMLLHKLARDFHNYPALGGLVQTLMSYTVGGDSSNWVGVLGIPHYNMDDMPGVSLHVALHLAQIKRARKFQMFDYGSAAKNMEAYGSPDPLDLGALYGHIDIPVDLVAGQKDRVIPPSMVRKHFRLMKSAAVQVTFREFEYAHLDFTFSHREELLSYVVSRLLLINAHPERDRGEQRGGVRIRKLQKNHSQHNEEEFYYTCIDDSTDGAAGTAVPDA